MVVSTVQGWIAVAQARQPVRRHDRLSPEWGQ